MIASHIHDALAQVRQLRMLILEKRTFKGYSGTARLISGLVTLIATLVMMSRFYPASPRAHLTGWTVVMSLSLALNYGCLTRWYLRHPRRDLLNLVPALDALPALGAGAAFSLALVLRGHFDLLFGTWMILYGLAQTPYRNTLPWTNYAVGVFYLVCGACCLLVPGISILDPRPMGLVFILGECCGGILFYRHNVMIDEQA